LLTDRKHGVQACRWVLEDDRDLLASHAAQVFSRHRHQVAPLEDDPAAGDPAGVRQQSEDGETDGCLAGTALASEHKGAAALQVERDAVDSANGAVGRDELGAEVLNLEDGIVHEVPFGGRRRGDDAMRRVRLYSRCQASLWGTVYGGSNG
jgi:hypothetical protein